MIDHRGRISSATYNCTLEAIGSLGKLVIELNPGSGPPPELFKADGTAGNYYKLSDYHLNTYNNHFELNLDHDGNPPRPTQHTINHGWHIWPYERAARLRQYGWRWARGEMFGVPNIDITVWPIPWMGIQGGADPWPNCVVCGQLAQACAVDASTHYTAIGFPDGGGTPYCLHDLGLAMHAKFGANDPDNRLFDPVATGLFANVTDGAERMAFNLDVELQGPPPADGSQVYFAGGLWGGGLPDSTYVVSCYAAASPFAIPDRLKRMPPGTKIHEALVEISSQGGYQQTSESIFQLVAGTGYYYHQQYPSEPVSCSLAVLGGRPAVDGDPIGRRWEAVGTTETNMGFTLHENVSQNAVCDITRAMQAFVDGTRTRNYYDFAIIPVPSDPPISIPVDAPKDPRTIGWIMRSILRESDLGINFTLKTISDGHKAWMCDRQTNRYVSFKSFSVNRIALTYELQDSEMRQIDFRNWPSMAD